MAPPIEAFPASQLPTRVQTTASGRRRKTPIDLTECELLEMVQYRCKMSKRDARIRCEPVERLFRR
ncbi:MAG: hypothetical protein M1817_002279 [Caeruleum heppii]|nr:MAG: hypothetical protein M1817_002279 [Caeruleum heppii]